MCIVLISDFVFTLNLIKIIDWVKGKKRSRYINKRIYFNKMFDLTLDRWHQNVKKII